MEQQALHNFLKSYFIANECQITEEHKGKLTVQLTEQLDEALMNRPFYWHYRRKLGQPGQAMKVNFITHPDYKEEQGEWIHFGSPRLHQVFDHLITQGKLTRLYEKVDINQQQTPLIPWFMLNVKVSYVGDKKRDEIHSIGLQLLNGTMISTFMENIGQINFSSSISDFCFTVTPIIRLTSAVKRVENYLDHLIQSVNTDWAKQAEKKYSEEKELLTEFFNKPTKKDNELTEDDLNALHVRFEQELSGLYERFKPKIKVEVINGGLFYLTKKSSLSFLQ